MVVAALVDWGNETAGISEVIFPRKGQFSIRINDRLRICFEWEEGTPGPSNVEIVDYH